MATPALEHHAAGHADLDAERLVPGILRHIQIRFVERQRLDERRDSAKDRKHLLRRGFVACKVGKDDLQLRTQSQRP